MADQDMVPHVDVPADEYHEDPNYNPANDNVDLSEVSHAPMDPAPSEEDQA